LYDTAPEALMENPAAFDEAPGNTPWRPRGGWRAVGEAVEVGVGGNIVKGVVVDHWACIFADLWGGARRNRIRRHLRVFPRARSTRHPWGPGLAPSASGPAALPGLPSAAE